ncbi:MAG: pilin [bacterium]|nr:pilin [bacterium]
MNRVITTFHRVACFCLIFAALPMHALASHATPDTCPSTKPNEQETGVLCLIQPLDDNFGTPLVISTSTGTFEEYFIRSSTWIFNIAISFCIIWVLIAGMMYMTSGNDQGRRSSAINRMTWAIAGLLMMLFAGFILQSINNAYYI